jgi:CubicO group peptidase (beta-lactamase class C family)
MFTRRYDQASSRALGWDTPSERSSGGDYVTHDAFGHTGFTGTSIWMDPDLDIWIILLTNRVHPTRENQKHIALRRAVADAAVLSITDEPVHKREPNP